ncbi:hypothetical protein CK203_094577 [Vitis vinifera]|uniref:Uncharacterized protein n=1 Tax=Vitis vinifera TaxID=29760 RepID=A0A438CJP4_VITVI|nr:hypothetical protein CK203_094577 [Vitis vinifera]
MASSQVEIASSSPFGCVLRDHNRREPPCRDSNAQAAFHNNLKVFVRDHVRPSISIIPPTKILILLLLPSIVGFPNNRGFVTVAVASLSAPTGRKNRRT